MGIAAKPMPTGQSHWCFDNECDLVQVKTGVGLNLVLTWAMCLMAVSGVLFYAYRCRDHEQSLPSYSACYREEQQPEPDDEHCPLHLTPTSCRRTSQ